jgi:hypothetical protein
LLSQVQQKRIHSFFLHIRTINQFRNKSIQNRTFETKNVFQNKAPHQTGAKKFTKETFLEFIAISFNSKMAEMDEGNPATDELDQLEGLEAEFSLKKKKKKPKKKTTEGDDQKAETAEGTTEKNAANPDKLQTENNENKPVNIFETDPPNYDYTLLLNRVVDAIHQNNPELADKKRFTMKPPQLMRGISVSIFLLSCL